MRAVTRVSKLERFWTSRFLRYFLWATLISHLAWYLGGLGWPYYLTLFASFLGPVAVCLFSSGAAGGVVHCICSWGHGDPAQRDRLNGEINEIRLLKTQRSYDKALTLVNYFLDRNPNFPEALYLKAHVLREGFKNPWAAETYFRKVLELTEDSEPVHRWASSCLASTRMRGLQ